MNFYLLSIIDEVLEEGMLKLSEFPMGRPMFFYEQDGFILQHSRRMIDFYILFFKQISFLSVGYDYYKGQITREISMENKGLKETDILFKKLINFHGIRNVDFPFIKNQVLPVHLHYTTRSELLLATGFAILEKGSLYARFILHQIGVPKDLIIAVPRHLHYLHAVLERYETHKPPMDVLLEDFDKNHNQFQQDCKRYFEDTFYQFYIKKKMIGAVGDILFTGLNLKEIAHQNDFSDYNNMYKVFKKYKALPLADIPRFSRDL